MRGKPAFRQAHANCARRPRIARIRIHVERRGPIVYLGSMITQKMKYALKALMVLADERAGDGLALSIDEVARRGGVPKRFLEHILLAIRNAGIIASTRGRSGGYVLVRDPGAVPLSDLLRLIDGPLAPLPCLSRQSYERCADCADEEACRIRRVFAEVFWSYLVLIESLTLADLVRDGETTERILAMPEVTSPAQ